MENRICELKAPKYWEGAALEFGRLFPNGLKHRRSPLLVVDEKVMKDVVTDNIMNGVCCSRVLMLRHVSSPCPKLNPAFMSRSLLMIVIVLRIGPSVKFGQVVPGTLVLMRLENAVRSGDMKEGKGEVSRCA